MSLLRQKKFSCFRLLLLLPLLFCFFSCQKNPSEERISAQAKSLAGEQFVSDREEIYTDSLNLRLAGIERSEESSRPEPEFDEEKLEKYQVKKNDTLMIMAFNIYGDYRLWRKIAEANPHINKVNHVLKEGEILAFHPMLNQELFQWPPEGEPYLILKGDTLSKISNKIYKTFKKWREIWDLNKQMITNPHQIFAGFTLYYIPQKASEIIQNLGETVGRAWEKVVDKVVTLNPLNYKFSLVKPEENRSVASIESKETSPIITDEVTNRMAHIDFTTGVGSTMITLSQTGGLGEVAGAGRINSYGAKLGLDYNDFDFQFNYLFNQFELGTNVINTSERSTEYLQRYSLSGAFKGFTLGGQVEEIPLLKVALNRVYFTDFSILSLIGGYRYKKKNFTMLGKPLEFSVEAFYERPYSASSRVLQIKIQNMTGHGTLFGGRVQRNMYQGKDFSFNLGLQGHYRTLQLQYMSTWDITSGAVITSNKEFLSMINAIFDI